MGSRGSASESQPTRQPPPLPDPAPVGLLAGASEKLVSALASQVPSVSLLDADLRFIAAEGKPLDCCGCSSGELAGKPFGRLLSPATAAYVKSRYQRVLAGETVDFNFLFRGDRYAIHADPITNERGDITAIFAVGHDLTEQRREAQAQRFLIDASVLLSSSLNYRIALAEVAKLAVPDLAGWCLVCLQTSGQFRWLAIANANSTLAARMQARLTTLGRIPCEMARLLTSDGPTLIERLTEEQLPKLTSREAYLGALRDLVPCSAIFAPFVGHDGHHGGFLFLSSTDQAGGSGRRYGEAEREVFGEVGRIAGLAVENALLREEAAEREGRLHDLIGQLLAAHEEERRRLAYDVHDQLAQVASSAYQHLQVLADRYHPRSAPAKASLDRALELSRSTIREARRVVAGLRPAALDDVGLVAAVGQLLDDLRADGWEVTYRDRLGGEHLPPSLETALFLVAQEALSNVRKHTGPTRVHLTLSRSGEWVHLKVRDWGRGFDIRAIPPAAEPGTRMGLVGMHDRVAHLRGRCDVTSRPGKGTRVIAKAPLSPSDELAAE
jgi:signal transduction histidine kinase